MRRTGLHLLLRTALRATFIRPAALSAKLFFAFGATINIDIVTHERVAIWLAFAVWTSRIGRHEFPLILFANCLQIPIHLPGALGGMDA